MKKKDLKTVAALFWAAIFFGTVMTSFAEDSLYEYYTNTPVDTLKQETKEIGKQLRDVFGQNSLTESQQQIDFGEYYSNLRRILVYATKLAAYSDYEKDLDFARDHEVFQGLPDEVEAEDQNAPALDRKEFVKNKYARLNGNIVEEIGTYKELILLSLDACETLADNDLSEFLQSTKHQAKIGRFMQSKEYTAYTTGKDRFQGRWPDLSERINSQLALWGEKPLSPNTPLIDRAITGAL